LSTNGTNYTNLKAVLQLFRKRPLGSSALLDKESRSNRTKSAVKIRLIRAIRGQEI
jgi:hypothetical protein